ncbi:MAG: acetyl-CoA carboxylase carboxyltransferase subunit alpha [Candidatus Sericytochromatia bacterium]|nr:acetyl-CoA carboxylase carboxyltransferase subunit alpha [Candidatus Tanganyikabacteria bacterium]
MSIRPRLVLDFERPILEIEDELDRFRELAAASPVDLGAEVRRMEDRLAQVRLAVMRNLKPSQRVQIARHPARPTTLDHIQAITTSFLELHGDRQGFDDRAIVGGLGVFRGRTVMFVGHQKGRDTKDNLARNFGMAHPEGYRKALRLFRHAAKFGLPIVTLIDTPGAYPGIDAEARGQSAAISRNMMEMARLPVPIVSIVIGEGSSGGALGLGVADRILMLEHAYYAVISPEGCAAILWKDGSQALRAAEALRMTAPDLVELGIIDGIIPEPPGGAHRNPVQAPMLLAEALDEALLDLVRQPGINLIETRAAKFAAMGRHAEMF